ncbi:hypothetical protein ACWCXB_33975 [Streptomyces sp. NPDC001514]
MVTVARYWIAEGDHSGTGYRRAARLAAVWRDRQDETVELLRQALARQQEPQYRHWILKTLAQWLPGTLRPPPPPNPTAIGAATTREYALLAELHFHLRCERSSSAFILLAAALGSRRLTK